MKTLTILFESPNVFYAVIDGVNIRIEKYIEEVKYACYQSDQRITGPCNLLFWEESILKPGDIFQVEGFEYEVKKEHCAYPDTCYERHCNKFCSEKVAILKLAKEEEPKEQIGFTIEEIEFIKEDERKKLINEVINNALKILRKHGITREFQEYKEIEKLKK